MNPETIVALGRVLERLAVCIFAGISVVLGWHLFRVQIVDRQQAEFRWKEIAIRLTRVGPGVFFALFGSAILIFCLRSPIKINPMDTNGRPVNISYLASAPPRSGYALPAKELNTLEQMAQDRAVTESERLIRFRALSAWHTFRRQVAMVEFGRESVLAYEDLMASTNCADMVLTNQKVSELHEFMTGTLSSDD
jgi:hypothetical protein